MEGILSGTESYSPLAWLTLIHQHDPEDRYVVTQVTHHKQRPPWPAFQPEYLTLLVRRRSDPDQPQPTTLIRVSRDVCGNELPARLGLWGRTEDTVTILGSTVDIQVQDEQLHDLTWTINRAPSLEAVSCFIACVHYDIPQSCLLKHACLCFVQAMLEAIHIAFHRNATTGAKYPEFLVPNTYLVYFVGPSTSSIHLLAVLVAVHDAIFTREEYEIEGMMRRGQEIFAPSCFSFLIPVEVVNVRNMAKGVAVSYRVVRPRDLNLMDE